jgi:hypothetical protein
MLEAVVGISHRHKAATAFAAAVERAERTGLHYGLQLELDPGNPHDQNAIKVWGVATRRRIFFGATERSWHIGYVAAELAEELQRDLISRGLPIAAELYAVSLKWHLRRCRPYRVGSSGI